MDYHAPDNMPYATGLNLPVELQLQVLSSLPARSIQSARGVCKQLRDIIDVEDNSLLVASIHKRERERIMPGGEPLCDPADVRRDFMAVLKKFVDYRGLSSNVDEKCAFITAFAVYWIGFGPATNHWESVLVGAAAVDLARHLAALHVYHHREDLHHEYIPRGWTIEVHENDLSAAARVMPRFSHRATMDIHGVDPANAEPCFSTIISADPVLSPMTTVNDHDIKDDDTMGLSNELGGPHDISLTQKTISRAPKLPRIPERMERAIQYRFRSKWKPYKMLESIKYQRLSELHKAWLMEDIYLPCGKGKQPNRVLELYLLEACQWSKQEF